MLANQPATPVSEMLRNVRRDQRIIFLIIILNVGNITNLSRRHMQGGSLVLLDVAVALMILFASWYVYRQRQLIKQLQQGDGATYGHIRESIRQMRALIKNKSYVAMAFLATVLLAVAYGQQEAILAKLHAGTVDWPIVTLGLTMFAGIAAALLYMGRRRQQRRYGQHLDRLESALHELGEPS
ncbi:hypothetical protein [Hymenobacter sediminicola]|uniref:Uncharacterized protein n=1 Tax=Hymenobacter sediminicola TaxID=2761579 RepID=A0A7G7W506_9BACT|nr:hypothetical protein [Hymenobacter sediminicola]QNH61449.1 hypothetical protein H4317_14970 [Hymenobacter sediminicola]